MTSTRMYLPTIICTNWFTYDQWISAFLQRLRGKLLSGRWPVVKIRLSIGTSFFAFSSDWHYLNVLGHADQSFFQSIERRRVQHLLLDFGIVGAPRHQEQLFFFTLAINCIIGIFNQYNFFFNVSLLGFLDIGECTQSQRGRNGTPFRRCYRQSSDVPEIPHRKNRGFLLRYNNRVKTAILNKSEWITLPVASTSINFSSLMKKTT